MKRKIQLVVLFAVVIFCVTGCEKEQKETSENAKINIVSEIGNETESDTGTERDTGTEGDNKEELDNKAEISTELSFDELKKIEFWFSSGAGAWATILNINPDGSFYGAYTDAEMGSVGDEYPNGTQYRCDFTGQFAQPVKINDYTYSMQMIEINYEKEAGTEEIIGGMKYCYSDAYGLEDAEDVLIYLPGAPLAELPEEFRSWVGFFDIEESGESELPFYALNNEVHQYGFVGYDIVENLKQSISFFEQGAEQLEKDIQSEPYTQLEYNQKTEELYNLWDAVLNDEWQVLKRILDEAEMNELTVKQREWIAMKEQEVERTGSGCEGGSAQPMIMNQRAAELTKERVYELLELLE